MSHIVTYKTLDIGEKCPSCPNCFISVFLHLDNNFRVSLYFVMLLLYLLLLKLSRVNLIDEYWDVSVARWVSTDLAELCQAFIFEMLCEKAMGSEIHHWDHVDIMPFWLTCDVRAEWSTTPGNRTWPLPLSCHLIRANVLIVVVLWTWSIALLLHPIKKGCPNNSLRPGQGLVSHHQRSTLGWVNRCRPDVTRSWCDDVRAIPITKQSQKCGFVHLYFVSFHHFVLYHWPVFDHCCWQLYSMK